MSKKNIRDYSYQNDAIHCITNDINQKNNARLLLIIPTGGGKTLTAIRSVNQLIKDNFINENNKCLWITHLNTLEKQTKDVIKSEKWKEEFNFSEKLYDCLDVKMKQEGVDLIDNDYKKEYRLIIIDECHHSSGKSYNKIFDNPNLSILGLTATPKRSDKRALNFEKTTYQITFDELEKRNVIIKPKPAKISIPHEIDAESLKSPRFDNPNRNNFIVDKILNRRRIQKLKNSNDYSKMVIYVNTVKHAKNLYETFKSRSETKNLYNFCGYIEGGKNSLGVENNDFLEDFKQSETGIIINVNVLSEGFDDPSINTITMAVPTNSLIRYIQCVGRGIRNPEESNGDIPIILECTEDLPNIDYRITYGWLFADISDDLQPIIETYDINTVPKIFSWIYAKAVKEYLDKIFKDAKYNLRQYNFEDIKVNNNQDIANSNIFLYWAGRDITKKEDVRWRSIVIDPKDKSQFVQTYNRINNAIILGYQDRFIFDELYPEFKNLPYLDSSRKRYNLYFAMYSSFLDKMNKQDNVRLKYIIFKTNTSHTSFLKRLQNLLQYLYKFYLTKKAVKNER